MTRHRCEDCGTTNLKAKNLKCHSCFLKYQRDSKDNKSLLELGLKTTEDLKCLKLKML